MHTFVYGGTRFAFDRDYQVAGALWPISRKGTWTMHSMLIGFIAMRGRYKLRSGRTVPSTHIFSHQTPLGEQYTLGTPCHHLAPRRFAFDYTAANQTVVAPGVQVSLTGPYYDWSPEAQAIRFYSAPVPPTLDLWLPGDGGYRIVFEYTRPYWLLRVENEKGEQRHLVVRSKAIRYRVVAPSTHALVPIAL